AVIGFRIGQSWVPVPIKDTGFPDFTVFCININILPFLLFEPRDLFRLPQLYNLTLSGSRRADFRRSNLWTLRFHRDWQRRGRGPLNGGYRFQWTWHHHEVLGLMQLVLGLAHTPNNYARGFGGIPHQGGALFWAIANGRSYRS